MEKEDKIKKHERLMPLKLEKLSHHYQKHKKSDKALFKFVLVREREDSDWYIYFGEIIFSSRLPQIKDEILYKNSLVIVAQFIGDKRDVDAFILMMKERSRYFVNGILNQYTLTSRVRSESEYFNSTQEGKERGFRFPFQEVRLSLESQIYPHQSRNLVKFRTLNELVREKLGIDLDFFNGLPNTLSFIFEIGLGSIYKVHFDDSELKIHADYTEEESYYLLKVFSDYYHPERRTIVDDIEVTGNIVSCNMPKIPDHFEIRLIYKDILVDRYRFYNKSETQTNQEGVKDEGNDEIIRLKSNVSDIKRVLRLPERIQLGEGIEKKLVKAEEKLTTDPDDAISALGESMEFLCQIYCEIFGVNVGGSIGIGIHEKVVNHWMKHTGKKRKDLVFQTGVRHIMKINGLKKHKRSFKTDYPEAKYLLCLAWRGYCEMLNIIQEVMKNIDKPQSYFENVL